MALMGLNLYAQNKKIQRGIDKYEFKAFTEAINIFKSALKSDPENNLALRYLANSYRKVNDYQNAELYYNLVINSDSVIAEDYFYYGQALQANGKLLQASEQFNLFSTHSDNQFLANLALQSLGEVFKWELEGSKYRSENQSRLNTPLSEYNLLLYENTFYITSNRKENYNSPESFNWDETPFLSILETDSQNFFAPKPEFKIVSGKINTAYHDGPISIDPIHKKIIITRVNNILAGKDFVNRMKLFEGEYVKGKWKNFKPLPFNSDEYSVGHACYADSGQTIIFASDMPGGQGGMDLYRSVKVDGKWGKAENLGSLINTKVDEVFPRVRERKLYFSSNGHEGYGGLDLFVSTFQDGWQKPENLKSPINSNRDDFSMSFITDSTGYYASNRAGGKGDDDLYYFHKSKKIQSVGISGVFEYNGLPVENAKILLIDHKDSIIAIDYTDTTGKFNFKNLTYEDDYLLKVEEVDPEILEDGLLYLTNSDGDKIKLIKRLQDGNFKFKALPVDEFKQDLLAAEDLDTLLPDVPIIRGKVYKKLPGDFNDSMKVYLLNDEGTVIDSVFTDSEGNFEFTKLSLDLEKDYFVKLEAVDHTTHIAFVNQKRRIYKLSDESESALYKIESGIDPSIQPDLATEKGQTAIIAKLEYNGLPLPYTKVQIFDANNKLIATIFTNEQGEFQYNKLAIDENYFFKLPDAEEEVLNNSFLYVINKEGDPLYLIKKLQNNNFKFTALPFEGYELVQKMEEDAAPDLIDFQGVVFRKLAGDLNQSMVVYLLNDQGKIIDSVITDERGKFNFKKLKSDENYFFKLDSKEDLSIALYNNENKIIERTLRDEKGKFKYEKLTYMVSSIEPVKEVDYTEVYKNIDVTVFGQVFKKIPGDYQAGMKVLIFDDAGNLIGETYTDEEGKFQYSKLKAEETYVFKVEGADGDYQIITLDRDGKVISKIIKNENGEFEYTTLPLDRHRAEEVEAVDQTAVTFQGQNQNKESKTETNSNQEEQSGAGSKTRRKKLIEAPYVIHYRFDSTNINLTSRKVLNDLIDKLRKNQKKIEVASHTDIRGPKTYNQNLSKRRTNSVIDYLVKRGISKDRIKGNYFGELKPIVDCLKINCTNADHAKNRRSEIKFID